jgi:hypothetical protein
MSDREELRDEARMERRREPAAAWQWEYVACNWVRVPVATSAAITITATVTRRCRYCNGEMREIAVGVRECGDCCYEEAT